MPACPRCSTPAHDAASFCAKCGASIRASSMHEAETIAGDAAERADLGAGSRNPELLPGSIIAGRYRVVARVGRGGMGEVYRADDLTLGQSVALKFMAAELASSPARRDRFIAEVRVARQITHPNVCRVHDIGFLEPAHGGGARPYLTMEFVDGEDLASLLRRIGRLPPDKAAQVGAQICAGLGAAHAQGVLHRDLKPANIMLDGRGQVRITDFGLAGFAAEFTAEARGGVRAGTPAYMAPEQLAGHGVSVRSDLFALGLVLYELFTGERAVRAETLDQIAEQIGSRDFALPGARAPGIDPAVEAMIMRCLEPRPEDRPPAAASVAAALPGGDPLAGLLAAGQTPDPSVLAASGVSGRLSPVAAGAWLAVCVACVLAVAWLNKRVSLLGNLPDAKPPAVLIDRARELLRSFGHDVADAPGGEAWGWRYNIPMLDHIELTLKPDPGWWPFLRDSQAMPAAMEFWYRAAPDLISPRIGEPIITRAEPPLMPGEALVSLDHRGRLVELRVAPRYAPTDSDEQDGAPSAPTPSPSPPPWDKLLEAAGLAERQLVDAQPGETAMVGDAQRAWMLRLTTGPLRDAGGRIEAASLHGRPVLFQVFWPWGLSSSEYQPTPLLQRVMLIVFVVPIIFAPLVVGVIMARRNWLAGRGDRRGALRVALAVGGLEMLSWLLGSDHAAALMEFDRVITAAGLALMIGGVMWMMYLALEPAIRRRRPGAILAWTRMTSGRWRDPMVGRDVLRGATLGAAWTLTYKLLVLAASRWPDAPAPTITAGEPLNGVLPSIAQIASGLGGSVQYGLLLLMTLLLLGRAGRARWLGRIALGILVLLLGMIMMALLGQPQASNSIYLQSLGVLTSVGYFFVLARFGLITAVFATTSIWSLLTLPTTLDSSAWFGPMGLCAVVAVIVAAGAGAWSSARLPPGRSHRTQDSLGSRTRPA